MGSSSHLERRRADCFVDGIQLRETLLAQHMARYGYSVRPFLKDVVDDLIEEELGARLLEEALPLDRYAQSEMVGNRIVVSVNRRTAETPKVKHAEGVIYVGKWHEAVHVERHFKAAEPVEEEAQPHLPEFETERPRLIVCRSAGWQKHENPHWEFTAEHGGLAAAIADADLRRCDSYHEFLVLANRGGDLGKYAWRLLYDTAERLGVNPPALVRYFGYRGLCRVVSGDRGTQLIADPQMFDVTERLESKPSLGARVEQQSLVHSKRPPG